MYRVAAQSTQQLDSRDEPFRRNTSWNCKTTLSSSPARAVGSARLPLCCLQTREPMWSSARAGPIALQATDKAIKKDNKIRPSGKHGLRIPSTSVDLWCVTIPTLGAGPIRRRGLRPHTRVCEFKLII